MQLILLQGEQKCHHAAQNHFGGCSTSEGALSQGNSSPWQVARNHVQPTLFSLYLRCFLLVCSQEGSPRCLHMKCMSEKPPLLSHREHPILEHTLPISCKTPPGSWFASAWCGFPDTELKLHMWSLKREWCQPDSYSVDQIHNLLAKGFALCLVTTRDA